MTPSIGRVCTQVAWEKMRPEKKDLGCPLCPLSTALSPDWTDWFGGACARVLADSEPSVAHDDHATYAVDATI